MAVNAVRAVARRRRGLPDCAGQSSTREISNQERNGSQIEREKTDGSQVKALVNSITFTPNASKIGDSFSVAISGANLSQTMYFDIRFRRPGSDIDEIAANWQRGLLATHSVPAGAAAGTWMLTGVRPHQVIDDFSGDFVAVSATLQVAVGEETRKVSSAPAAWPDSLSPFGIPQVCVCESSIRSAYLRGRS